MIEKADFEYYKSNEIIAGSTYGEWTVSWWKWALTPESEKNPVVDPTGLRAAENQPKDVWFLAGIFGERNIDCKYPSRRCSVPYGRSILIPVINCEADYIEYPELKTDQDIMKHVLDQANSIEKKECFINGELISPVRVSSDPIVFDIYIHPDFDRFRKGGGYSRASADGYYVFLKPPPKGEYQIVFNGSCENGSINSGASYFITIN